MKSELKFSTVSFKFQFTVGLFVSVIILGLAVLFRRETSIILLASGLTLTGGGVVAVVGKGLALWHNWQLARLDLDHRRQEVRLITYQADKARMESDIIALPRTQRIVYHPDRPISLIEAAIDAGEAMPAARPVDLLPALDAVQRCLIVGASDAGKTTLLQWIIARRLSSSNVVVIDPHSWPEKWPGGKVVGVGRNYAEIDRALTALVQLMTQRYDDLGKGIVGEGQHRRITVIIDEWRAIVQNAPGAADVIKTLLTESRKAAFSVFVATHSERVKAIGIEGEGDLKDGFAIVRLHNIEGQRSATLDSGNGPAPAILPGRFVGGSPVGDDDALTLEPAPTEQEAQIIDLADAGLSHAKICEAVWGYKSSNKYPEIDATLAKFGIK